jgi:hypothetical protein
MSVAETSRLAEQDCLAMAAVFPPLRKVSYVVGAERWKMHLCQQQKRLLNSITLVVVDGETI